ncbi:MAG: LysM peptidoglycan-binding domain-containing protein [Bacteroidaceae bacterium]|nr:LysM peptidoglycan-binding domain-containing protein [Bacteroidaceae bacterium]
MRLRTIKLGSARGDENGRASGGKAGDQTKKEVSEQSFYMHSKGWHILRAKNKDVAQKLAVCMRNACNNNNIGYDQSQRLTLYNVAGKYGYDVSKVNKAVETDCSALVRVCCLYAGINVGNFTTVNEKDALLSTKAFTLEKCNSSKDVRLGDIVVTKTKGHTCIVTEVPEQEQKEPEEQDKVFYTIQRGDTLSKIATKYNTTAQAIQKLNPSTIKNINLIVAGSMIRVK